MTTILQHLAAVLCIAAVPALAAATAHAADQRIVITAPSPYTASPISGAALMQSLADASWFAMSDGQRLELVPRGSQLRMRYAGRAPVTLRPDGSGRYSSSDGRFDLMASRDAYGDTFVRLTRPAYLD